MVQLGNVLFNKIVLDIRVRICYTLIMKYEHTLTIKIVTLFPEDSDPAVAHLVQAVLGPWCTDVKVVQLNKEITK